MKPLRRPLQHSSRRASPKSGFARLRLNGVLSILAWWSIPIGAVLIAAAVSGLSRRLRRQGDDDTIDAYRRYREALGCHKVE